MPKKSTRMARHQRMIRIQTSNQRRRNHFNKLRANGINRRRNWHYSTNFF